MKQPRLRVEYLLSACDTSETDREIIFPSLCGPDKVFVESACGNRCDPENTHISASNIVVEV